MTFQLPDERSTVRYLLDSIVTTDAPFLAAIDNLCLEDKDMIDNFEKASAHLLMYDPVAKRKSASGPSNRYNLDHVSEVTASESASASYKVSKGKTGVKFRHCKIG